MLQAGVEAGGMSLPDLAAAYDAMIRAADAADVAEIGVGPVLPPQAGSKLN
jgi:hypothetical protein